MAITQGNIYVRPSMQGTLLYVYSDQKLYSRYFEAASYALAFACTDQLLISGEDAQHIIRDHKMESWNIARAVPDSPSLEALGFIRVALDK